MISKRPHDDMAGATTSPSRRNSLHWVKRRRVNRNNAVNKKDYFPHVKDDSPLRGVSEGDYPYDSFYHEVNLYVQIVEDCRPFYNFDEETTCEGKKLPPRLDDAIGGKSTTGKQEDKSVLVC